MTPTNTPLCRCPRSSVHTPHWWYLGILWCDGQPSRRAAVAGA